MPMIRKQATNRILMVRPAVFGYNPETAANNAFQKLTGSPETVAKQAQKEFDNYVSLLRDNGVDVLVVQDSPKPHTPDSIFPNNWFSTHITGELVLYPMFALNRQQERKLPILATVGELDGVQRIINLKSYEAQRKYLEGTGSMVLDRINKIAYCCASERSSVEVLDIFKEELDYSLVFFHATDTNDAPIYHTNVMMCVATHYAVVCLEAIKNDNERETVINSLTSTGHEVITITLEQVNHFAGNMLELESDEGKSLIIMSAEAKRSLTFTQIENIEKYSKILAPELYTIETNGGGSARCMIAEIFL
ncbi:amidinotransferase [Porphyromonas macacae]|uniref:Amidinotransferase n=1 Tax=Porphyromonas macacae TaxID=28115 RepID=A0A0A2EC66_9PORP|nr:arginine deiminase-related protein [Porphyromonas macacae]KGN75045.1 amidinotransferase [Porphyromonas macacae]KGO00112.1 amidinotransferase [Porphyromonas macacae]